MRHRVAGRKLGVTTSHRKSMLRNMVTSLFEHGKIVTTDARAKELRILADKMVTLAKRGDLHARRQVLAVIRSKAAASELFGPIRERFAERSGGYVRVIKKGFRVGDNAPVSIVELVSEKPPKKAKKGKGKKIGGRLGLKKREGKAEAAGKKAPPVKEPEPPSPSGAEEARAKETAPAKAAEPAEAPSDSQESAPEAASEETKD